MRVVIDVAARRSSYAALTLLAAIGLATAPARAGSLEISPILVDVPTQGAGASMLTLRNRSAQPARIQLRLFRWSQSDGTERFEPADGVAVSPPFATIPAGETYVVRVVRTAVDPIVGEESYRLLIDELPEPGTPDGTVTLAVRHSLPVFFRAPAATAPAITWTATTTPAGIELTGRNDGDRRVRIANLRLVDATGRRATFGSGLTGYLLGRGGRSWSLATPPRFALVGARVEYDGETGAERTEIAVGTVSMIPGRSGQPSP